MYHEEIIVTNKKSDDRKSSKNKKPKDSPIATGLFFDWKYLNAVRFSTKPNVQQWLQIRNSFTQRQDAVVTFHFCQLLGTLNAPEAVELVIRCHKILRMYQFNRDDINTIFACTLCGMEKILSTKVGRRMDALERGYVSMIQVFLAHCWLMDACIPLAVWQRQFFENYCSLRCLETALMRLWLLADYRLHVELFNCELKVALLTRPDKDLIEEEKSTEVEDASTCESSSDLRRKKSEGKESFVSSKSRDGSQGCSPLSSLCNEVKEVKEVNDEDELSVIEKGLGGLEISSSLVEGAYQWGEWLASYFYEAK